MNKFTDHIKNNITNLSGLRMLAFALGIAMFSSTSKAQCPITNPNCNGANHWIFGDSCYLQFTDTGVLVKKKAYSSYEASSSLSDEFGNLELYSNSKYIFKANGDTLATTRCGDPSTTQGVFFLDFANSRKYYVLNGGDISPDFSSRLCLSSLNKQDLSLKEEKVLVYPSTELIAVVNHQNKKYKWIGAHEARSDRIFFFLLKSDSIQCCPVIEHGYEDFGEEHHSYLVGYGQMKFSPNGKYFAFKSHVSIELSYFDCEYAKLDSTTWYQIGSYGVEFSQNSKNVLTSAGKIFEIYSTDSFPPKSHFRKFKTIRPSISQSSGALQLAPDGKIYAASFDDNYIGVFENPNDPMDNIIYKRQGLKLHSESTCQRGLPAFNASIFHTPGVDFSYSYNCNSRTYTFSSQDTMLNSGSRWEIKNLRTGKIEHRGGKSLNYTFAEPAVAEEKYQVSFIILNNWHRDTATKIITVRPTIKKDFLGQDTFYCEGESLTLKTPENLHCIHWMGQEPNMDTTVGPYVDYAHFHSDSLLVDSTGTYYVRINDKNFCTYYDTIRVGVRPKPSKPIISNNTGELASDIEADSYRWYFNDSLYASTKSRSILAHDNGYFQVKLVNEYGCESELSDSFLVDWVNVEEIISNPVGAIIYPNPASNSATVILPSSGLFQVSVFNKNGKIISDVNSIRIRHELNLMGYSPGVYTVVVLNLNTNSTSSYSLYVGK